MKILIDMNIMKADGTMARLPDLKKLKKKWGMKLLSIASLIEYRHKREKLVIEISMTEFTHSLGAFRLHTFKSVLDDRVHYALSYGKWTNRKSPMVRVQTANILSDVLGFAGKESSSNSVENSLRAIVSHGCGALLYLEPRRNDNTSARDGKIKESGSAVMDFRDYGIGAQILVALGIKKLKLISRDRRKVVGLEGYGLEITDRMLLPKD